jgi:hypothetical protein
MELSDREKASWVARPGAGGVTIATVAAWMDDAVQRPLPWGKYLEIMDK